MSMLPFPLLRPLTQVVQVEASLALPASLLEHQGQAVEPSSTLGLSLAVSGLLLIGLEVDALVPLVVVVLEHVFVVLLALDFVELVGLVFVVPLELVFVEPLELSATVVFVELDLLLELFVHLCTLEVV